MHLQQVFTGICAVVLVGFARTSISQPQSKPNSIAKQMQITVQADKHTFASTESVIVSVTMVNKSSKDFSVLYDHFRDLEGRYKFIVRNSQGKVMPLTRYGTSIHQQNFSRFHSSRTYRVKSGQKATLRFSLSRIVDLTISDTYKLTVVSTLPSSSTRTSSTLTSNVISFQVTGTALLP